MLKPTSRANDRLKYCATSGLGVGTCRDELELAALVPDRHVDRIGGQTGLNVHRHPSRDRENVP